MRISVILGTIPEIIIMSPIIRELEKEQLNYSYCILDSTIPITWTKSSLKN